MLEFSTTFHPQQIFTRKFLHVLNLNLLPITSMPWWCLYFLEHAVFCILNNYLNCYIISPLERHFLEFLSLRISCKKQTDVWDSLLRLSMKSVIQEIKNSFLERDVCPNSEQQWHRKNSSRRIWQCSSSLVISIHQPPLFPHPNNKIATAGE